MTFYGLCKGTYHGMVSESARDMAYRLTPNLIRRLRHRILSRIERTGRHDEVYDADYYAKFVEPTMQLSAATIAADVCAEFRPATAVDVGCGTGVLMQQLMRRGVRCTGFEYSHAALDICLGRALNVHRLDIEHDPVPDLRTDVAISTEVAEHLPTTCADRYVDMLCSLSSTIVLTAAVPGQGGTDHVNERPHEYWIEKFASRGFMLDLALVTKWRTRWKHEGVAACFAANVMVFRNR